MVAVLPDGDDDDDDDEAMACKGSERYSSLTMYVPMRFRAKCGNSPATYEEGTKGSWTCALSRLNDGMVLEGGIGRSKGLAGMRRDHYSVRIDGDARFIVCVSVLSSVLVGETAPPAGSPVAIW